MTRQNINNNKIIFNYLKKNLNRSSCLQSQSQEYMTHPYIFIQPDKKIQDEVSKIKIDISPTNIFL